MCILFMKAVCSIRGLAWQTAFPISVFGVDKDLFSQFSICKIVTDEKVYTELVQYVYNSVESVDELLGHRVVASKTGEMFLSPFGLVQFMLVYLRGVSGLGQRKMQELLERISLRGSTSKV